ncbi:MAG: undecaprenyldiphospho-muramoylpentapeptide beta-N-acetylglucosaminyltransferase [bacterium]
MKKNPNRILLSGGGTGGSVTPLIALVEELKLNNDGLEFLWLGTKKGIEFEMVDEAAIPYVSIASGKFRRYFSLFNISDILKIFYGFWQSLFVLLKFKPAIVVTAGSFVAVPVAIAAWVLRIPVLVHQMDFVPGLANRIMAPFARVITVVFARSLNDYGAKARLIGNPVRPEIKKVHLLDRQNAIHRFGFKDDLPIILVVGGGTGAEAINKLVVESLAELTLHARIIHQTGASKTRSENNPRYIAFDFLDSTTLTESFAASDIVISRAGLGFITEISYLGKPMVLIPMPNSHQEENARMIGEMNAAIVLKQNELTPELFAKIIMKLLEDKKLLDELAVSSKKIMPANAAEAMAEIVTETLING